MFYNIHDSTKNHTSQFPFGIYWWTLKNLTNQNFEKMKKNCWGYHHFTHVYRKPQSYEVQFLRYKVTQIFVVILGHFFGLLPPLTTQITKILKKWKNPLDISSFYTSVPQMTVMWYMVPEISTATEFFHHLWPFFAVFTPPPPLPNSPKKENFKEIKKAPGDIIILHKCTKIHDHILYCS